MSVHNPEVYSFPCDPLEDRLRNAVNPLTNQMDLHLLHTPVEVRDGSFSHAFYDLDQLIDASLTRDALGNAQYDSQSFRNPYTNTIAHWRDVQVITWPGHMYHMREAIAKLTVLLSPAGQEAYKAARTAARELADAEATVIASARPGSVINARRAHAMRNDALKQTNTTRENLRQVLSRGMLAGERSAPVVYGAAPGSVAEALLRDTKRDAPPLLVGGLIGVAAGAALARWQIARATHGTGVVHRGPHR